MSAHTCDCSWPYCATCQEYIQPAQQNGDR
ncbi:MAG: hypothetical protein AVDCRST_MAG68-5088 [uncultured Gemmatimonadetes bacterium]|uniref:Uncharacterized protein n=1 Tax=uncultured Gemmatimonadota bacterium TaxID=203437 RepID=A0A6J4MRA2_9BACT|nr:MAG: hypothetical protein AVDCRST_MAG68-5088 [uncultured Gemmatimonadota bacterium]